MRAGGHNNSAIDSNETENGADTNDRKQREAGKEFEEDEECEEETDDEPENKSGDKEKQEMDEEVQRRNDVKVDSKH